MVSVLPDCVMPAVLKQVCDQFELVIRMRELRKLGYLTFVVTFIPKSDKFLLKTWRQPRKEDTE